MIAAPDLKDASGLRAEECSEKWALVGAVQARVQARAAQDSSPIRRPQVLDWPRRLHSQGQVSRPAEWEHAACASAHRA